MTRVVYSIQRWTESCNEVSHRDQLRDDVSPVSDEKTLNALFKKKQISLYQYIYIYQARKLRGRVYFDEEKSVATSSLIIQLNVHARDSDPAEFR